MPNTSATPQLKSVVLILVGRLKYSAKKEKKKKTVTYSLKFLLRAIHSFKKTNAWVKQEVQDT